MRIVNLIENTEGGSGCEFAHGLSFYIETEKHRVLLDLGPSEKTLLNAEKLGIDLSSVDTVILSHGHYDHSGGMIPFAEINKKAVIYMQQTATDDHYGYDEEAEEGKRYRYIGIDKRIKDLPQVRFLKGDYVIDDELELLTIKKRNRPLPFTNGRLFVKLKDEYVRDEFSHEHFLVIHDKGRDILMSGCAHNGIPNILDAYREKYGKAPDVVISGFHLMKKSEYSDEELREIIKTARELDKYDTRFITCHCTGIPAYRVMKNIMGEKLGYVHSGDEIPVDALGDIKKKEGRSSFMKWHKFFAWATVFCFCLTMITGYEKK
ncbi:MAG: MBL fold metallo-hydrolase [Lachnospiraceae bacterium]|nr:MBL fold metallo-hydrolase [Lachnospiraceae bacterium]